ncbi:MAG: hypothetical protein ACI9DK_000597 [Vicingaceae bacterium]
MRKAASSQKIGCFVSLYFGVDAKMYLGVYTVTKILSQQFDGGKWKRNLKKK